ncbi:MAG: ATP-binding protein [Candidatus Omnitrophota bacterium]
MKNIIANDSYLLKEESKKLIALLKSKGIDENIIFDIHVGFEEALRNAMIHGNKMEADKKVTIDIKIKEESIVISVEDEGDGFDPGEVPDPTLEENLLRDRGRGVYLITNLMDKVKYEDKGRCVIMEKKFRKCPKKKEERDENKIRQ